MRSMAVLQELGRVITDTFVTILPGMQRQCIAYSGL